MSNIGFINVSFEVWGVFLSVVLIACVMLSAQRKERINRQYALIIGCNAMVLLSDALAISFKGDTAPINLVIVRVGNCASFALGYVLMALFAHYLHDYIGQYAKADRRMLRAVYAVCAMGFLLVIVSQFTDLYYRIDEHNLYVRQPMFWLSQVWGVMGMAMLAYTIWRHRADLSRMEMCILASYIVLPVVAMVVQVFVYGLALLNIANTLSVIIIYLCIQAEQNRRMQESERALAEGRIAIMMSQIQPHFLYNTLTAISRLCDIDSQRAKRAIIDFSGYLRGNLDSLTQTALTPFHNELRHIEIYLSLEKMRFEDKLNIVYDIEHVDFLLPTLCVQPLVENAVRYGIGKRPNGGTLTISTGERGDCFVICVEDDGVGFDVQEPLDDRRQHVGIQNVRNRLKAQCRGTLEITSRPGEGTRAVVTIPKGGVGLEHCGD